MSLPVTSGGELVRFLVKQGFVIKRQRGSHVILKHNDKRSTSVPLHNELDRGTLRGILIQVNELEHFIEQM
ncbi:MAG: type II toxin-antitoxin system HicA family toxin [Nitrosopumilus sp.]|nr:type II toxin-antitoxin system HicA family toxin [Nitrosopumilus sp.]